MASVFCWVDLRSALPEATWEAERQLWEVGFVQRCGFIITPGANSQNKSLYVMHTQCQGLTELLIFKRCVLTVQASAHL